MALTAKAKAGYDKYQKVKKAKGQYDTAKGHYNSVKNIIDEDTRSEEYFKLGLKGLMKLGEKAIGQSLSKHPYFAYHKVHLEVLGKAITASSNHKSAMKALHQAIASADSTKVMTKQLGDLKSRKQWLMREYSVYMAAGLQLLRDYNRNPAQVAKQMETESGSSPDKLRNNMDDFLYSWRARICELNFDGVDLFAMVDIEYKAASAAYKNYEQKVQKLQKSSNLFDMLGWVGAERQRNHERLNRVLDETSGGASPDAIEDPSVYAGRQRDDVADVVEALAAFCDIAMSSDAYNPNFVMSKMGSL